MKDFSSGSGESVLGLIALIAFFIWAFGLVGCTTVPRIEIAEGDKVVGYANAQESAEIIRQRQLLPAGTQVEIMENGSIRIYLPTETTWETVRAKLGIPRDDTDTKERARDRRELMYAAAATGTMAILALFLPFIPAGIKGTVVISLAVISGYLWIMYQWQVWASQNEWVYLVVFGGPLAFLAVELLYLRPRRKSLKNSEDELV